MMARKKLTILLPEELLDRLRATADRQSTGTSKTTVTALIERGAELALRELERKRK